MIKLLPHKKHVLAHKDETDPDVAFTISWIFPLSALSEMDELRKKFTDPDAKQNIDKVFASSIKEQEGFIDEEGKPLIVSGDSETAEVNRAAIYDYVKAIPEYMITVLTAFAGPRAKNLSAGAMPQSTGNGVQESVSPASSETNA